MDAAIEVENKAGSRVWSATKVKDDALGGPTPFQLKAYTVGKDEDGLPVTSCAVDRALLLPSPAAKPLSGRNQKLAMSLLRQALSGTAAELPEIRAVELVAGGLTCAPGRRRTQAKGLLDALVHAGHLRRGEGGITIP